jgi:hypothetical protein
VEIRWNDDPALGVYVVAPTARIPVGPVLVEGIAYWVLETEAFPTGFAGPIMYGAVPEGSVDESEKHGGQVGGVALESGECYKFAVITQSFDIFETVMLWP